LIVTEYEARLDEVSHTLTQSQKESRSYRDKNQKLSESNEELIKQIDEMYIVEEENAKLIEKHSKIQNMYMEYAKCNPRSNNDFMNMNKMLNQTNNNNFKFNSNEQIN